MYADDDIDPNWASGGWDRTEGEIVASVTYVTLKLGTLLTTLGCIYPRGVSN